MMLCYLISLHCAGRWPQLPLLFIYCRVETLSHPGNPEGLPSLGGDWASVFLLRVKTLCAYKSILRSCRFSHFFFTEKPKVSNKSYAIFVKVIDILDLLMQGVKVFETTSLGPYRTNDFDKAVQTRSVFATASL